MRRSFLAALLVVSAAAPAWAQAPAEPAKDLGKSIIDQELEPAPGGYAYNPQGRRDPFISLVKPVGPQGTKGPRPQGIPGFLIQEVALKGVVKINRISIDYAFRPRLRCRLTLSRLTLLRKP